MNGKWTYERWVLTLGMLGGLLGGSFGFGVHWAKITVVEAKVDAQAAVSLRRDVYEADQLRLAESIDRLSRAIERMEARDDRERAERPDLTPRTPVFGR